MKRWQYIAIIIIALVGIAISADLTYLHIKIIDNPDYQSFCNISEKIDCDSVNSSKYSEILSIPISHLGSLTYILIIILAFSSLRGHPLTNLLSTFNLLIFVFCNLYSLLLFYISLAIIRSLCILCCALYLVNLLLLFFALPNIKDYFTLRRPLYPLRGNKVFSIVIATFMVFALISILWLRNVTIAGHREAEKKTGEKREQIVYKDLDISGSFSKGPENAPITLVEITDFDCPFCRKAYPIIKEAALKYKDRVRFVLKFFPLGTDCNPLVKTNMHPRACLAAYAAVCAGEQGRFWDYTDRLMNGRLDRESILNYAVELGLDQDKFKVCLDSDIPRQAVRKDVATCVKCRITGVPTVFINDRALVGVKSLQEYLLVIEEEIDKQKR